MDRVRLLTKVRHISCTGLRNTLGLFSVKASSLPVPVRPAAPHTSWGSGSKHFLKQTSLLLISTAARAVHLTGNSHSLLGLTQVPSSRKSALMASRGGILTACEL